MTVYFLFCFSFPLLAFLLACLWHCYGEAVILSESRQMGPGGWFSKHCLPIVSVYAYVSDLESHGNADCRLE
ncbi:uncharacterized protein BO88DRAFT_183135 [Aspergillus vadensis CBS 113365]|uniref:Secreted protein n=1 Tax=Aspergillus vadensis (strain CBS 113365 / IMI 142717 / IBT 24658) TaxID=1448311 RepID=A0A319AXK6_ASPVC|nr:hypothetical protein BO88DRAFT_183135 [Aspergillus vadensis CBS 113365]PYH64151.1 hypothetical protein BO88DRAFT_183135 [Aspergillus vadensis CBS 113365]